MADAAARVYGPAAPGTTNGTLYTVPGATTLIVRGIHIANTTAALATISLALNGSAATPANCFLEGFPVEADGSFDWSGFLALAAAETIQGLQGTSGALTVIISGVLVT